MLTFHDGARHLGRREFLRIGALGCGALTLPALLQARAKDAGFVRNKSIVFLFMQGGPSQHETFDPKVNAPVEYRTVGGEIATNVPGLRLGSTFKHLAKRADRLTVVRSYVPGDAKHDIKPLLSEATNHAGLGAIYSRLAGTTNERTGLPTSVCMYPKSVDPKCGTATTNFGRFDDAGLLGAAYAPFVPGSSGPLQEAMKLSLSKSRLDDRRNLLKQLDDLKRSTDASGAIEGMDDFQQQAFQVILNGAADAFDLTQEDPKVVAAYDTAPLVREDQIDTKWSNHKRYLDHNRSLGKLMLLTRRLVEAGVGFITVNTDFVWDSHADKNNCGVEENMRYAGLAFDHAVSRFLDDLEERGLSDKVLLVCCGEIGRTPRLNPRGGRDHWGNLGTMLLAGGGMPRGRIYGQSTPEGGGAAADPVSQQNLIGTLMHTAFDVNRLRLVPGLPSDLLRTATENAPIAGLV